MDDQRWPAQEPPDDFADRVMNALDRDERTSPRKAKTRLISAGVALLSLAAAAAVFVQMSKTTHGDVRADGQARREVPMGDRVTAVLEPGAHLAWTGNEATQDEGDVFYRVERGGPLTVHTPAGDVTVHGTCFRIQMAARNGESAMNIRDVKAAGVGAAITALATVLVYEGKVSVSHAGQGHAQELSAGQSATLDGHDVQMNKENLSDPSAAGSAGAAGDEPYAEANKNLAASVHEYQSKLAQITAEKADVETRLQTAQQKLASAGGGEGAAKDPFDLSTDDWKAMAEKGAVKYRIPCSTPDWAPSADKLSALGLSPDDGPVLARAVKQSNQRTWGVIAPLCAQALGGNPTLAATLGPDTCTQVISGATSDAERETIMKTVGQIRAGLKPEPGANDPIPPMERAFLTFTAEPKLYEADLAKALGPEEAHRLISADTGCVSTHSHS